LKLLERFRHVIAVASIVLVATTLTTLVWSVALTVQLIGDLIDGGWRSNALVAELLGIIDLLLIATVQVIVAVGLWELFVGELTLPDGLRVGSLSELKTVLAELIVLVIAIKFVEKLIDSKEALDVLYYAGGVALVGLTLVALSLGKKSSKTDEPKDG
jgi:uncharacterized membrane protein YqhA